MTAVGQVGGKYVTGVQEYTTPAGRVRYRVRWRRNGHQYSETFHDLDQAIVKRAELVVEASRADQQTENVPETPLGEMTLGQFVAAEWLPNYLEAELAPTTVGPQRAIYNRWIREQIGTKRLTQITPQDLERWRLKVKSDGIGEETYKKAKNIISSIYGHAMRQSDETGVYVNPARSLSPYTLGRKRRGQNGQPPPPVEDPAAYPPAVWEGLRSYLRSDDVTAYRHRRGLRDALLVSLFAYAGLRPGEALFMRPRLIDLDDGVIHVDGAIALGEETDTKTGRRRDVPLLAPLAEDLEEFVSEFELGPDDWLFTPTKRSKRGAPGGPWTDGGYRNWRSETWRRATRQIAHDLRMPELASAVPYDGRSSYASMMLRSGWSQNLRGLADIMGHSLTTLSDHYARAIARYNSAEPVNFEDEIRRARQAS